MSGIMHDQQKSNKVAEVLRHKAVHESKIGKFHEALINFNKSLCHAEPNTSTIAVIYANRAAVYYQLNLYDKSLNNILLARECHNNTDILNDLDDLEEKCYENITDQIKYDDPWDYFKLSYPANKRIPFIIDCLEVKNDKKFGRYVTTTRALNAGDILAIEEPFFKILKVDPDDNEYPETNPYNYCANCLLDNYLDLIPCDDCLTTMFCSRKCMEEGNRMFHQYECNILDVLKETNNFRMAVRNFFVSLSICNKNIEELKLLMEESDEKNPTIFNFDLSLRENNSKDLLMAMMSLTHQTNVRVKDMTDVFQHHKLLKKLWSKEKEFINKFLERMMQVEILNFHGIKGQSLNAKSMFRRCVGDGSYAFCSLLNHSCCPNVMRIVVDNRMVLICERPIKAGEQLFDCYIGDSFYYKSKDHRQEELEDYNFTCDCQACANDYADILSGLLPVINHQTFRIAYTSYKDLQDPRKVLTIEQARKLAKKYSLILNQSYSDDSYPCKELVMLQLCIVKCFLTAAFSPIVFT
ncbi:SET and MYND domain-containing protein DDB_G0273589-like [Chironomus tepperi]|uniref:SET and MYND domain-containing protein DDB_G0273589-like n=1 Tax=Chironomus tepperi TaxID=113505 RepID=UPI00391F885A